MSGKAVPVRKNSISILSIKASPWLLLLCTSGAGAFFIKDGDGDILSVSSDTDDPSVTLLRLMNMLKIRRHSSAVVISTGRDLRTSERLEGSCVSAGF